MTDIKELRLLVQDIKLAGSPVFVQAADMNEILDRLEAAESDGLEQARLNGMGASREAALMAKLEAAEKERDECNRRRLETADHLAAQTALMKKKYDALRAKIAEMEQQEPIARTVRGVTEWVSNGDGTYSLGGCLEAVAPLPDDAQLYALPGAQSVPDVDALAQLIREIDGKHQLGAGALAERIVEWLAAAPEAKP